MPQRNWLITGVSSGLGRALAQAVIAAGDRVTGTVRSAQAAAEIGALHPSWAVARVLDVTEFSAADRIVDEVVIGVDLVGKAVEAVTGQDLETYFRRHILDPLSMHDTSFVLRNDMAQRLVGTHVRGPDGEPVAISIEPLEEAEFHTGGAGLFSTAPDYITFTRTLLAGGTLDGVEVLKPETVQLMARNAIGDLNVPVVRSNNPVLALEVETFPGQVKKWGLTFLINTEDIEGFRSAGSLTWGGVHNTYFWIDLKRRITAVALIQILPIGDPHVQGTMIAFERMLYAAISSIA